MNHEFEQQLLFLKQATLIFSYLTVIIWFPLNLVVQSWLAVEYHNTYLVRIIGTIGFCCLWLYYVIFNIRLLKGSHELRVQKITQYRNWIVAWWWVTVFLMVLGVIQGIVYSDSDTYNNLRVFFIVIWATFSAEILTYFP